MNYAELYLKSHDELLGADTGPQEDSLAHHGIKRQKWRVQNGPPYPLDRKTSHAVKFGSNPGKKRKLSIADWYAAKKKAHKKKAEEKAKAEAKAAKAKEKEEKIKAENEAKAAEEQRKFDEAEKEAIRNKAVNSGDPEFVLKYAKYLTNSDMEKAIARINLNTQVNKLAQANKKTMGERVDDAMKWIDRGVKAYNYYADWTATKDIKNKNNLRNKLAKLDPNKEEDKEKIANITRQLAQTSALPRFTNAADYLNKITNLSNNKNDKSDGNKNDNKNSALRKNKNGDFIDKDGRVIIDKDGNIKADLSKLASKSNNKSDNQQKSDNNQNQTSKEQKAEQKKESKKSKETPKDEPKETTEQKSEAPKTSSTDAYIEKLRKAYAERQESKKSDLVFKDASKTDYDDYSNWTLTPSDLKINVNDYPRTDGKKITDALNYINKHTRVDDFSKDKAQDFIDAGAYYLDKWGVVQIDKKKLQHSELAHSGRLGMKWDVRNGPPYPLTYGNMSSKEKKLAKNGSRKGAPVLDSPYDRKPSDYIAPIILNTLTLRPITTAMLTKKLVDNHRAESAVKKEEARRSKLKVDPKTGFYLKEGECTPEEDMKHINPGYKNLKENTKQNCSYCTTAYELRRRGYDVQAMVNARGETPDRILSVFPKAKQKELYKPNVIKSKDKDGKEVSTIQFKSTQEKYDALTKELLSHGDGARGNLLVAWNSWGGHSVAWENQNGNVIIRDCQSNKTYSNKTDIQKLLIRTATAEYFRTDNVDFDIKKAKEFVR